MIDIAYMVREDWAQQGTAMVPSSARIRDWLGAEPYLFAVPDVKKFNARGRNADVEVVRYISPDVDSSVVVNIAELPGVAQDERVADAAVVVVVLHPFGESDSDALDAAIGAAKLGRVFVMVWSPQDSVRLWLDARGAVNLHAGTTAPAPDPLLVAAAELMVCEEYNGLSVGRGKESVVQLLRVFTDAGYPLDEGTWLRAYFTAGGRRHADAVSKFIREMRSGVRHRVKPRYPGNIMEILRARIEVDV
jgi:hypothetical protein